MPTSATPRFFSAGRLPVRSGETGDLPIDGRGDDEWRGFEPLSRHAHRTSRTIILNWNNKPARNYAGGDDRWTWGSIQRVTLLRDALPKKRKLTLRDAIAAMNAAATQDLRCELIVPTLASAYVPASRQLRRPPPPRLTSEQWSSGT
jgi:penicillin G amidase